MNFREIFSKYPTDKPKYADFYSRHFAGLSPKVLLEIGVFQGGSLRGWKELFPSTRVVGIEINTTVAKLHSDLEILTGDQLDKGFLDNVISEIGIPDIIIDDGGHKRSQQIGSFKHLYPKLNKGGIYVIEDLETGFLHAYNDGPVATMEELINVIRPINYDDDTRGRQVGYPFHYSYSSITFEPNVCLIRK